MYTKILVGEKILGKKKKTLEKKAPQIEQFTGGETDLKPPYQRGIQGGGREKAPQKGTGAFGGKKKPAIGGSKKRKQLHIAKVLRSKWRGKVAST